MVSRIRASLRKYAFRCTLTLSCVVALVSGVPAANAYTYLSDGGNHPPPTSGGYAYYNTYGTFGPNNPGFPVVGQSFVDPVFGNTITRLTNEVGTHSWSDIYAKNGFLNADNTLVVHNTPAGRRILNVATGAVVHPGVPGNDNASFDPNDPDIWWWYTFGGTTLNKYRISTSTNTVVKNFGQPIGNNGGSVDWIDASGRYMLLRLGSTWRIYDVQADLLYAGAIPDSYGGSQGWAGLSPDANWVVTTDSSPNRHRSFSVNHGTQTVNTTPNLFWTLCGDHGDLVSASDGKTYMVTFECDSEAAVYAVDVSLPQSPDNKPQQLAQNRRLFYVSWSDSGHFSGVSRGAMRDWSFASIESGDDTFGSGVGSWRPYKQELVMANVLTGEVRRLAHHRSRSPFADYYYTPRVSVSWDGGVVTWVSNFGNNGSGYADLYTMRNDAGPPPLTVTFTSPGQGAQVSGTTPVSVAASGGSGSGYYYRIYAGETLLYEGPSPNCDWDTTKVPDGPITLTVQATDDASGSASATRDVTVANSGLPLTIAFTAPESGAPVSGTVTVAYSASGGSGHGYTYTVSAGADVIYQGPSPSFSWDTTTWPDGPVTLTVIVIDDALGTAQATRDVTVANEGGGGPQAVVWIDAVNVAVAGNTITKNGGCAGCWDAGAASQQAIPAGNGYVEFRTSANAWLAAGLSNGNPGTSVTEIKWALKFFGSYVEVRESGVYKADWPVAAGDVHRVAVEGGLVKYYRNGTLKYTSTRTPTYPMLVDSTIEFVGHAIQNAVISW